MRDLEGWLILLMLVMLGVKALGLSLAGLTT